ncbi:MAG: hypothetical protein HQL91_03820 [Magnetococcales bacterium]|nr:hypothetical protein [Magnetococcales bacterium]
MKSGLRMIGVCLLGVLLTACGGGGSGSGGQKSSSSTSTSTSTSTTTTTTYYGVFQGSTVVGVHYKTELNGMIREGETDDQGRFQYLARNGTIAPVTFSVGGVELGAVTPTSTTDSYTMSVHDLVSAADPDVGNKAINLQRFLSSVNTSGSSDVIRIDATTRAALAGQNVKLADVAVTEFDTTATGLVNTLISASVLPSGSTLATPSAVTAHMQETKTQIDAARIGDLQLTNQSGANPVADGRSRVLLRILASQTDGSPLAGGLVHLETTVGTFGNETDLCQTATPVTNSVDKTTDASGLVYLFLTPRCQSASAQITATLGGRIVQITVPFTAAPSVQTSTYTGLFQGYTLVGLHYRTELNGVVREGETDAEGKFQFLADGTAISPVTFSIGGVTLGTMTPSESVNNNRITIHDLIAPTDLNAETKAINLQRFLKSISTGTSNTLLQITAAERTALTNENLNLATQPVSSFDSRATTLINTLIRAGALPSGTTLVAASAVTALLEEAKIEIDATRIGTFTITSGATSLLADGSSRVTVQVTARTLGEQPLPGGWIHFTTTAGTLGNETNLCATTTHVTATVDKFTDANGTATVILTPRCQAATATVTAALGGKIASTNIRFLPGPVDVANSTIAVTPVTLPADGETTATVTVTLRDAHNNPVADRTPVTLLTDLGTLDSAAQLTSSGRANFTLTAPATDGTAHLSVEEYPGLTATLTIDPTPSTTTTTTHEGTFRGFTLIGVHYRATLDGTTREGLTDAEGKFRFLSGEHGISPVTFSIGGVVLGTVTPTDTTGIYPISVHDLVNPSDADAETKAINLQRFLSAINTATNTNLIRITAAERTTLAGETLQLGMLPVDEFENQATALIQTLIRAHALPSGTRLVAASSVLTALQDAKILIDAARVDSLVLTPSVLSVPADGATRVVIQLRATTAANLPLPGGLVHFTTTLGTFDAEITPCATTKRLSTTEDQLTNANGVASIMLTPRCQSGTATVSAALGGRIVSTQVAILPGGTAQSASTLAVMPATLPADGQSTATVTVTLRDANDNPVADGTAVTLLTDLGQVETTPHYTSAGAATFTLTAGTTTGTAHLTLREYPALSTTLTLTTPIPVVNTSSHDGIFYGATLVGLRYRSELDGTLLEGETDDEGKFQFLSNGSVIAPITFSIGGVVLGVVTPTDTTDRYPITIHDLVNASDVDAGVKAINLQRFLRTLSPATQTRATRSLKQLWRTLTGATDNPVLTITTAMHTALTGESVRLAELAVERFDARAAALITTLIRAQALASGTTLLAADAVVEELRTVKTQIDALRVNALTLTTGAESVLANGRTRILVQLHATTASGADLAGGLVHFETTAGTLGHENDLCAETTIPTSSVDKTTNGRGVAYLFLTPQCLAATATITASLGGKVVTRTVEFLSSGDTSQPTPYTGLFQGYTLQGIHYRTELNGVIREGETDAEGKFQFLSTGNLISPVTFSVGGVVLGTMTPIETLNNYRITIHDLVSPTDLAAESKAINIQRFLSTIGTLVNDSLLRVPAAVRTALASSTLDLSAQPVSGFDSQATSLITTLIQAQALPSDTTLVGAGAVSTLLQNAKVQIDAARIGSFEISSGAASVLADGTSQVAIRVTAKTLGNQPLPGGWLQLATTAGSFGNEANLCASGTPTTPTVNRFTDTSGAAVVMLTPRCQAATATITAALGGKITSTLVRFVPNTTSAAHSTIAVHPATLPADGQTHATVTVTLRDTHNNPVANDTPVTLLTDLGSVTESTQATVAGVATFTLTAGTTTGTAHLSLREFADITTTLTLTTPLDSGTSTTHNGLFLGSTLVGVHYLATLDGVTREGETDAEGKFQFLSNGTTISPVTFSLGGVVLGVVTPTDTSDRYRISVHDLVNASDVEAGTKAINLQRFLRTIATANGSTLTFSAATRTALGSETARLNELPVANFDSQATALINTLIRANALTSGTTLVSASSVTAEMREIKIQVDATRIKGLTITPGAQSVLADGRTRILIQLQATSTSDTPLVGGLVHFETTAGTLGSETNLCQESTVTTPSVDKTTDAHGVAHLFLTPRCQATTATVTASLGGMIVSTSVRFLSGTPSSGHSSIQVNPLSLPADGQSTATVTVTLHDANDNPVADQTPVTLLTSAGTLQGNASGSTLSGVATFTLVAPTTAGTAQLTTSQYDYLTQTVTFTPVTVATTAHEGIFLGSTVVGLHYSAQLNGVTQEGETDAEGKFHYFSSGGNFATVTFSVGGVVLGSVTPTTASSLSINVHDLVSSAEVDQESKAVNLQRFLTTLNTGSNNDTILISAATRTALAAESIRLDQLTVAAFDAQATSLIQTLITAHVLPSGTTLATTASVLTHLRETKSQIDAARIANLTITAGADTVLADGATRVLIQLAATTIDNAPLSGGLIHLETTAGTFGSEGNLCNESTTVTSSVDKLTDANGRAFVMLTPRCQTASAVVSATMGGVIVMKTIQFTPGPATVANSSLVVNPTTLPADGHSTATVTIALRDVHGNPVQDGTTVTLHTDAGSVQGNSSASTLSGRATFTLLAPATSGEAHLSISEYDFLAANVTMGVVSSTGGKPNSLQMSSGGQQIFVRGVGKTENVGISIQVRDDVGDPLNEAALSYPASFNNLRVTLKSRPHGGETIAGIGRTATATTSDDIETKISSATSSEIRVRSSGGSATVTLTSGTRPGIVEFQVDALDVDGTTILASAVSPLIAIASGPAHAITLTEAYKEGVVNLKDFGRGGVYCRLGSVLVTDRYGNAVPDGTTVSLNLSDSILASSTDGVITSNSNALVDANATFTTDGITLAGIQRTLQAGDMVMIEKGVEASNRRRFVQSIASNTQLTTNNAYADTVSGLTYYVGASLRGGAIHGFSGQQGCDPSQLTTGVATTTGGVAPIRVTYPAIPDTLQLGCLGYSGDVYSNADTRFPNRSGQVMIVAAANESNDVQESGITWINKGKFCFSAVTPATLTSAPNTMGEGNNQQFTINFVDAGLVPIPFVDVTCSTMATSNTSGTLTMTLAAASQRTDLNGDATFTISISGGGGVTSDGKSSADTGSIVCTGFSGSTTIAVTVP